MDLTDLRIFSAVVREGGITRAAEKLHRVQSNVTTRIRQLETKLDVRLFSREGKRLVLTPSGRILLDYADLLLEMAEEAIEALHAERPVGTFRLGAMESTAAVRLPAVLSEYTKRHPNVVLDLQTGNPVQLSNAVLAGDIDAALIAEPVAEARFDAIEAFEEEPVIVTALSEPAIEKDGTGPKTIIVFEHGCPHRRLLEQWYVARNDMPERTVELGSYHAMLGCVLAGMGAALVPRSVISTFPEQNRLRINPLSQDDNRLRTMLIWRKNVSSPKVRALAEILNGKNDLQDASLPL